ncbi:hypothetical protein NMG60_11019482 [Bertholletia excelsa]
MDVGFSPKPLALSLSPLTPSAACSYPLCPYGARSFRREFLGCGHNLRPPGLRSRRKCKKLGFHLHTPRLLIRASVDSQSALVVVAMVTISAFTVVFVNSVRKKNMNFGEATGSLFLAISEQVRGIMNQFIDNQSLDLLDLGREMPATESKHVMTLMQESRPVCKDESADLQPKVTALVAGETFVTSAQELSSSVTVASTMNDSISLNECEAIASSLPLSVPSKSSEPQSLAFRAEILKPPFKQSAQETEFAADFPALVVNMPPINVTTLGNDAHANVDKHEKPSEIGEIIDYGGMLRESGREALYTFYKSSQSRAKPASNWKRTLYSHASLQDRNNISSSMGKDDLSVSSQSNEGKIHLASYKESSPSQSIDVGKRRGLLREETSIPSQDGHKYSPQPLCTNGMPVNKKHPPPRHINGYNRLLKDGRLLDCIELLEDMVKNGLLDMDKVYHASFFKKCKQKRAVKEAFRFTKLIPNPTLSTFNMLTSVCASSQDSDGAFEVLRIVQEAGLKADCKLYTTLISTCAKSGKVDAMFKVFHEMVNAGVEPNVHTYGALIDGCAKAGQVAKAFGAYGIMRSKNVKPDRVVFNALITACGQSGAVDRAFDVLAEMTAETQPIDPDHITIGALIKACTNAGQVDRAREVYNMIHQYNIKGTPEVYTIAVNSCSQTGDWDFAYSVYNDMTKKGVVPDEIFLSAFIDVAGHAGKVDTAFEILKEARNQGMRLGSVSYSSLMGACSNAKNWQKALELYEDIKSIKLKPTISMMNALITALCDADQQQKALEILSEMERVGLCPNTITYSILLVASEKKDDLDVGLMLLSQAKKNGVTPNLVMSRCLIAMCLRRFENACMLGEPVLSFKSGRPQIDNKWTSLALMIYRETIIAGVLPNMELFSQVMGCLRLPHDASLRNRLIENLEVSTDSHRKSNLCSLVDGFGEYDPRAFSLFEEAASLGIVPSVSFKESPIVVDVRNLQIHTAEVYLLTVLKGLKHRLAAGVKLPNINILLPTEKTQIPSPTGEKTINIAGRISQAVAALLRRLGLAYHGNESYGKIRINGVVVKRWFQPKLGSPFSGKPTELIPSPSWLGKGISYQQRRIRTGNLSLD